VKIILRIEETKACTQHMDEFTFMFLL